MRNENTFRFKVVKSDVCIPIFKNSNYGDKFLLSTLNQLCWPLSLWHHLAESFMYVPDIIVGHSPKNVGPVLEAATLAGVVAKIGLSVFASASQSHWHFWASHSVFSVSMTSSTGAGVVDVVSGAAGEEAVPPSPLTLSKRATSLKWCNQWKIKSCAF